MNRKVMKIKGKITKVYRANNKIIDLGLIEIYD